MRRLGVGIAAAVLLAAAHVGAAAASTATCPPPAGSSEPAEAAMLVTGKVPVRTAAGSLVACVGAMPLTGATFNHWALVAERSEGRHPHERSVLHSVMGFLISSDWVLGEAALLGVSPSEEQVRHSFDQIRDQQFPKHGEFDRFLRRSGETLVDLLFRVRLNLESQAIQKKVVASVHGDLRRQKALSEFVKTFKARWKAQTICAKAFAIEDCAGVKPTGTTIPFG